MRHKTGTFIVKNSQLPLERFVSSLERRNLNVVVNPLYAGLSARVI
jgi:hypothetical protein